MRIYIATRLNNAIVARDRATWLHYQEHTVVSTWHGFKTFPETWPTKTPDAELPREQRQGINAHCVREIETCDTLLALPMPGMGTGGMMVEIGIAYALRKRIVYLAGDPKHYTPMIDLPGVQWCTSMDDVLRAMRAKRSREASH